VSYIHYNSHLNQKVEDPSVLYTIQLSFKPEGGRPKCPIYITVVMSNTHIVHSHHIHSNPYLTKSFTVIQI